MYKYYNANPGAKPGQKKHHKGDCVIRAITTATGQTWVDTFDALTEIGRRIYTVPSDVACYSEYLDAKYPRVPVMHMVGGKKKRLTPAEVCKMPGTFIIKVANHLTAVKEGVCMDTWDCTKKSAYIIWWVK